MNARIATSLVLVGVVGWLGLVWLGVRLYATNPPTAGFDLELLLQAGRDVVAGRSPYDPALVAGSAPVAESLFYSYPPVVAQAMALVAWLASPIALVIWGVAAVAGLAFVADGLRRRLAPDLPAAAVVGPAIALVPLMFPLAIGVLFGNLDVFFPLLYGLLLLGILPAASRGASTAGGIAASVAGATKLHPGSLGLWLLVRAIGSAEARRAMVAAVVATAVLLAVSLVVGGTGPWSDYVGVVRAGSRADLVDPRNAGPAAQVAMLALGRGADADSLARTLQVVVTTLALVGTALVAWRLRDPVESLAWAAAASLVILPVTWYHYPSALIPFAIAALLRAHATAAGREVTAWVVGGAVIAAIAIAWLPLLYVAIGLVLVAVRRSAAAAIPAHAAASDGSHAEFA